MTSSARVLKVAKPTPVPLTEPHGWWPRFILAVFVVVPFLALLAAIPVVWEWGLSWSDAVIAATMYLVTGTGITVGFHRYFTHASFKAGTRPWALLRGLAHAHTGWLFAKDRTNPRRYAPDLLADRDVARVSRLFPLWVAVSLLAPAVAGGLVTMSWRGALTAFFWGSLVRMALLHHITWSVNSVCHVFGAQPFASRDRSTNVWWLALPSLGESWHNLHHAEPTSARHGVLAHQWDPSARLIRIFEILGWATDVHWPDPARIAARKSPEA